MYKISGQAKLSKRSGHSIYYTTLRTEIARNIDVFAEREGTGGGGERESKGSESLQR